MEMLWKNEFQEWCMMKQFPEYQVFVIFKVTCWLLDIDFKQIVAGE